jgi:hypothetical protein
MINDSDVACGPIDHFAAEAGAANPEAVTKACHPGALREGNIGITPLERANFEPSHSCLSYR